MLCLGGHLLSPANGVSSVVEGGTVLFGMGRGVTPLSNHQDKIFDKIIIIVLNYGGENTIVPLTEF